MKVMLEIIVLTAFVLGLFFMFEGEPDLWDKWHAHAMEQGCKPADEVKP